MARWLRGSVIAVEPSIPTDGSIGGIGASSGSGSGSGGSGSSGDGHTHPNLSVLNELTKSPEGDFLLGGEYVMLDPVPETW